MNLKLNEQMRLLRKKKKLTQCDVAVELGMSETNYGNIERGTTSIKVIYLQKFAQLVNVDLVIDLVEKTKDRNKVEIESELELYKSLVFEKERYIEMLLQYMKEIQVNHLTKKNYLNSAVKLHLMFLADNLNNSALLIFNQAVEFYERVLEIDPICYDAMNNLAHLYLRYLRKVIVYDWGLSNQEIEEYLLKSMNLYKCVSLSESLLSNSRCISNKMNLILVEYLFLKKQGAVTDDYLLHHRNYFLSEIDNQFGIDQVDMELNYNLACIEANLGNYNQCMRYLFLAENKIYDVHHPLYLFKERLKYDEDFIPLRKQPMFIKYLNN